MKIVVCGDFVCRFTTEIEVDPDIIALFDSADYVAVNYEGPISGYGSPIPKSGPSVVQMPESTKYLEDLGVNIIMLANNHIMDQGRDGCDATVRAFGPETAVIGAGQFADAYHLKVISKDGLRIGLLNLTHKEFGALDIDAGADDYGAAWINHPVVNKTILDAKNHCDVLIVLPHAGVEDLLVPLPEWRARYKEFIDLGADAVIASHPHTPQGWEEYNGKMIFYSLGNFFFQSSAKKHTDNWPKGLMVELEINHDHSIGWRVYNTRFTNTQLSMDNSTEAKKYNEYLCDLLRDDKKYRSYLNEVLKSWWPIYKLYLLRGLGAIAPTTNMHLLSHAAYGLIKGPDMPMMLNNFQCESHRWAIGRILKMKSR